MGTVSSGEQRREGGATAAQRRREGCIKLRECCVQRREGCNAAAWGWCVRPRRKGVMVVVGRGVGTVSSRVQRREGGATAA